MYSNEIEDVMANVPNFLGVFSRNTLPKPRLSKSFSLIANTDKETEFGTHWVAFFVDERGRGNYFDSYGLKPYYDEFTDYLNEHCVDGYSWNKKKLQCNLCVTCGQYCCCYIILRQAGYTNAQFLEFFSDNEVANDLIVKKLFESIK